MSDMSAEDVRVEVRRREHRAFRRWIRMADAQEDSMASDEDLLVHEGRAEAARIMRECLDEDEAYDPLPAPHPRRPGRSR